MAGKNAAPDFIKFFEEVLVDDLALPPKFLADVHVGAKGYGKTMALEGYMKALEGLKAEWKTPIFLGDAGSIVHDYANMEEKIMAANALNADKNLPPVGGEPERDPATILAAALHWLKESAKVLVDLDHMKAAGKVCDAITYLKENLPKDLLETGPKPHPWNLTKEEMAEALNGNIIMAIKMVRQRTWMGLKDAKDLIEEYLRMKGNQKFTHVNSQFYGHIDQNGVLTGLPFPKDDSEASGHKVTKI